MPHVLTVTQLTRAVKEVLEAEFPLLWVRGQVSNLSRPSSGHVYFSLADETAVLPVVWFKKSQWRESSSGERVNPATGEVDLGISAGLEEGADVLVAGRLNVYEPRGVYQLVAEMVQEQGVGGAQLAFEALKRKLAAEGLFDQARKMRLPANPRRVAVVTSAQGAAIKDFLRISEGRGLGGEVRIHPTAVQGAAAPASIAKALARACGDGFAEVIILIRGGGAAEDLSAFNTEEVARAVADSPTPVVAGVGHEIDHTLADMAADVRAATPSHAAQLLWPERAELAQDVDRLDLALRRAFLALVESRRARLETLHRGLRWLSPSARLVRLQGDFEGLARRLIDPGGRFLQRREGVARRR
ncbi:MAG: exodeoxyribonuclease VII large subunit, partial [Desulfovibrionaceae bacterium]